MLCCSQLTIHDLHTFNTAMLAKQCWRLLEDLNSLCARVLCARYYSDVNLLKAKLKSGSSCSWQSVFYGIQNFNRGCTWRVGEGDQINIWEEPWIPTSPTRKFLLQEVILCLIKLLI
jgi:hypothetical protein